jgi:glycine/D-amino acid oxidase-like deaminating enzyme
MPSDLEPVPYDEALPEEADVVVVGGGIIGVSTALCLAERGVSVVLCEKGAIGGEQSSRNWGWCRNMGRHPHELPLGLEAMRMWQAWNGTVVPETGFRRAGVMWIYDTEPELEKQTAWLDHARLYQIDTRVIRQGEIERLLPGVTRKFAGALYTPSDARAEPSMAAPAIARAAQLRGATILGNCAVRGVETKAGSVSAVVTERGAIRCGKVVLAGGIWSRLFCGNLGIDLPQLKVRASVMRTTPLDGPDITVGGSDFTFRKRLDGGYTVARRGKNVSEIVPDSFRLFFRFAPVLRKQWPQMQLRFGRGFIEEARIPRRWALDQVSPFEATRIAEPVPDAEILDEGWSNLVRAFPLFGKAQIAERWAGLIDTTPDATPIMSDVAALPGLLIATGFSGHGFGLGPAAGRLMAELATGAAPCVDPTPFRFDRFSAQSSKRAA